MAVLEVTVLKGDTPWPIARPFGLEPESIPWANDGLSAEASSMGNSIDDYVDFGKRQAAGFLAPGTLLP